MSLYKIKDLMPGIRRFHAQKASVAQGKSANGRPYYPTTGYEYFDTPSGSMEISVWLGNIKGVIRSEGLDKLYDAIQKYVRKNCAWLKSDTDVELYAAEVLCRESYKAWKDFEVEA